MSKPSLAILFFVFGALSMSLVQGASIDAAPLSGQAPVSDEGRPVFIGGSINFGSHSKSTLAEFDGAVPTFISIEKTPIFKEETFSEGVQPLDGLDCRNCIFKNADLSYSGGAYHLVNATFEGTTNLTLAGAAANTVAFIKFMQGVAKGVPGVPLPPNKPIRQETIAKRPMTKMQTTAPYIAGKN